MKNERERVEIIQDAVMVALGCTNIDYSPRKLSKAAKQIAVFVESYLVRADKSRAECIAAIFGDADPLKHRLEDAEIALNTWDAGHNSEYWLRHPAPANSTAK